MPEPSTIATIIGLARTAIESLRGLRQLSLSVDHQHAVDAALQSVDELKDRLSDVHEELIELRERNFQLQRQIDDDSEWKQRRAQYELVNTTGGAKVLRSEIEDTYACPVCTESKKIVPLQNLNNLSGRWQCPSCSVCYNIDPEKPVPHIRYEPDY